MNNISKGLLLTVAVAGVGVGVLLSSVYAVSGFDVSNQLASIAGIAGKSQTIYVSPEGSDTNPGTWGSPVQTPRGAVERVRTKLQQNDQQSIEVIFFEGDYYVDETINLTHLDDPAGENTVTYKAIEGADVNIIGGKIVDKWKRFSKNGIYRTEIDKPVFALFENGKRGTIARYPNDYSKLLRTEIADGANEEGGCTGDRCSTFTMKEGDIREPTSNEFLQAHVYPGAQWWNWESFTHNVENIDQETGKVTLASETKYPMYGGNRYYLQNDLYFTSNPGEFSLQRSKNGKKLFLYYMPRGDIDSAEVVIPTVGTLLKVEGLPGDPVRNVAFENLTFKVTDFSHDPRANNDMINALVRMHNVKNVTLQNNALEDAGMSGVVITGTSQQNTIVGNSVTGFGFHGIYVLGPAVGTSTPKNWGNTIVNNRITNGGHNFAQGSGVVLVNSASNKINHNEFSALSRSGIQLSGEYGPVESRATRNNIIEFNEIHNVLQRSQDGGGIYMDGVGTKNVIRNNRIYDIESGIIGPDPIAFDESNMYPPLATAIYGDFDTGHIDIYSNTIYDISGENACNIFAKGPQIGIKSNVMSASGDTRGICFFEHTARNGVVSEVTDAVVRNNVVKLDGNAAAVDFVTGFEEDDLEVFDQSWYFSDSEPIIADEEEEFGLLEWREDRGKEHEINHTQFGADQLTIGGTTFETRDVKPGVIDVLNAAKLDQVGTY